ncbi:hypothetical protein NC652_028719 [Populus alba x Populus x berolinensis]|uniref:DUF4283 domain-containing protein n=1 Tax=Populus alba x Populus x berolinensis TaxID=444605 RepID=A0AAD6M1N0_9ROSI|nr:hypothetical protein NC652_028719 [Populus alba x Populus x berolinensis]KAJ6977284.1 hypothetical protein NC653_029254 [Populus alba x Populus x berolinensis]
MVMETKIPPPPQAMVYLLGAQLELCYPWRDTLIIKRLYLNVRLKFFWRLTEGFELMDVGHEFFMVEFDQESDRLKVINRRPWMIYDYYMMDVTLNMVFYDDSSLLVVTSTLGSLIKVDMNTLKVERSRFARICVKITLNQPVVGKVWIHIFSYSLLTIL